MQQEIVQIQVRITDTAGALGNFSIDLYNQDKQISENIIAESYLIPPGQDYYEKNQEYAIPESLEKGTYYIGAEVETGTAIGKKDFKAIYVSEKNNFEIPEMPLILAGAIGIIALALVLQKK
jgi:hypothetical protein